MIQTSQQTLKWHRKLSHAKIFKIDSSMNKKSLLNDT